MIHYYDKDSIESLDWTQFEKGEQMKAYLYPLIKEGVTPFVANVQTQMGLLAIGQTLVPLTLNHEEYQNSYVASNYYVVAFLEEWLGKTLQLKWLKRPLGGALGRLLRAFKVNRVIFVNNWLLPGNPAFDLSPEQCASIGSFLGKKFPAHLIMWRNIDTFNREETCKALKNGRYRMLKTRMVYIYDPAKKNEFSSKVHYHHRKDTRLLTEMGYERLDSAAITSEDIPRLLELYQKVYMEKHTPYSPQFTARFLQNTLQQKGGFNFFAVKKEGKIDGIMGYVVQAGRMSSSFFGYETSSVSSQGLYRMLTVMLLKEAEKHNAVLNDGSGGGQTKKIRGLRPFLEYVAIYDRHLPLRQRFLWALMEVVTNHIAYPLSRKWNS